MRMGRGSSMEIVAFDRRFDRRFDRSSFDCGKPDLDDWLKTKAGQQERANNTRTFLAIDGSRVACWLRSDPRLIDLYIPETYSEVKSWGGRHQPCPKPKLHVLTCG
jgi:hypothetical protein